MCSQCNRPIVSGERRTCGKWIAEQGPELAKLPAISITAPKRRRAANYLTAVGRWFASGLKRRPAAEVRRLLAICQACEHFTRDDTDTDRGICSKCGCGCAASGVLFNKLAMRTEHCPLDPPKW